VRLLAARPYSEYIGWLQRQSREAAEEHWRRYLEGLERATALQLEEGEGWRNEGPQAEEQMRLSAESTARLQQVARRNGLTMNTVLQAAWAVVLSGYSGEREVVYGATVAGRPAELAGVETMVGLFINTLPVRVGIEREEPVVGWMKKLQQEQLESQ